MSNTNDTTSLRPRYPSYEELQNTQVVLKSPAGFRIFWTLDNTFPDAISVMKDRHDPNSLEPYISDGVFHPISLEPISVPEISSIKISVDELDQWEIVWKDNHNQHDFTGTVPADMWFGPLNDYDPAWDSDRETHKLGCCEEARPRGKRIRIIVSPADGDFVTVHDYLTTLHPVLISAKDDIESARAEIYGETDDILDLMVDSTALDRLFIKEKSDWFKHVSIKFNPRTVSSSTPAMLPVLGSRSQSQPLPQKFSFRQEPFGHN